MSGRGRWVLVAAALWVGLMAGRLYQLQVVEHERYVLRAAGQQKRPVTLDAPRGTIYDRRGRELAISVEVDSAAVNPAAVGDPEAVAVELAAVLGESRRHMLARLNSDGYFAWIKRKLDEPEARGLRELELPGVSFLKESKRYYPQRTVAGRMLGFVGTDNYGLGGLEARYEKTIAGQAVKRTLLRDARDVPLLFPSQAHAEPAPGDDLYLTLDATIQYITERELAVTVERHNARRGTAVVLDPRSGEVLAMASYPFFDPNEFSSYRPHERADPAISHAYEPGSTFKVVAAAAALEESLFDPGDVFDCERGSLVLDGVRIKDHKSFDMLTFREVLEKSSNVGTMKIAAAVGARRLHEQIEAFGFGRRTGIDLPGESPGIVRPLDAWQPRSYAYISFGQEIAITPLQLAAAFGAIANGGTLYRPFVVAGSAAEGGTAERRQPQIVGHPIRRSTALTLERMLEGVVADGTGTQARVDGYRVAGKTGTAQKVGPGGGYSATDYVASFAGFAPARDPAVVAVVVIDEPRGSYHGGEVAAPTFARIVEQVLFYLGVPPDDRESLDSWPGEVPPESVLARRQHRAGDRAMPLAVETDGLPDLGGLTARQALVAAARLGLEVTLHGNGLVERQRPAPGSRPEEIEGVELWLSVGPS